MNKWKILENKINSSPKQIHFWWRDDDARDNSPNSINSLTKLLNTLNKYGIPAVLAVIPEGLTQEVINIVK
jgi:hypothetical protein